jgi:hypothetical protein
MSTVYQAGLIRRRRRTQVQVETLENQIFQCLLTDRPQSVRHLFYRMTNPRLAEPVEKTDQGYSQVQDRITKMRMRGFIPFSWITDSTRRGYHTETYRNTAEALRAWQGFYRGDLWSKAGVYVEVWCESRSIAGVIEDTCTELAVSLYPAGGFSSLTLSYEAAEYINRATSRGEIPAHVIYLGDFDPAGLLIGEDVESKLKAHLDPRIDLTFDRIAITPEQIIALDLPTRPRKAGERRKLQVESTVEAEAMPAALMRDLLRTEIESFLPPGALAAAKAAEESERSLISALADALTPEVER